VTFLRYIFFLLNHPLVMQQRFNIPSPTCSRPQLGRKNVALLSDLHFNSNRQRMQSQVHDWQQADQYATVGQRCYERTSLIRGTITLWLDCSGHVSLVKLVCMRFLHILCVIKSCVFSCPHVRFISGRSRQSSIKLGIWEGDLLH
jgi:hypothetical protein